MNAKEIIKELKTLSELFKGKAIAEKMAAINGDFNNRPSHEVRAEAFKEAFQMTEALRQYIKEGEKK